MGLFHAKTQEKREAGIIGSATLSYLVREKKLESTTLAVFY